MQHVSHRRSDEIAQRNLVDLLIQAALDTLHHDTDDGDAVDKYEREVLRRKFTEILGRRSPASPFAQLKP